jgi:hypothetical protein
MWTTSPVYIRVCHQRSRRRIVDMKTVLKSAFEMSEYVFDMVEVRETRIMHV